MCVDAGNILQIQVYGRRLYRHPVFLLLLEKHSGQRDVNTRQQGHKGGFQANMWGAGGVSFTLQTDKRWDRC